MLTQNPKFSFFDHLKGTFTSPIYYLYVPHFSWWTSASLFFLGMSISGLLFTAHLGLRMIPKFYEQTLAQLTANYPHDVKIDWDTQQLMVTPTQTHSVPYHEVIDASTRQTLKLPNYLLWFSPSEVTDAELLQEPINQHLLVLSPRTVNLQNVSGQWTSIPLVDVPGFEEGFSITDANKSALQEKIGYLFTVLTPLVLLSVALVSPFLLGILTIVAGILEIFLLYLLLQLNRFRLTFSQTLKLALHILAVSQVVTQLTLLLYGSMPLPILSIAFWAISLYLILSWNRSVFMVTPTEK